MKARIRLTALLLLAIFLAGCSRDGQPGTESAQPDAPAAAAQAQIKHLSKALPNGVKLSFAYRLRSDRVKETKPGKFKRGIRIEYLGMDQAQVVDAVTADMAAAGYKIATQKQVKGDRLRIYFKQPKHRTFRVTVGTGGKLQDPSAHGLMDIYSAVKAPAAKKQADATTTR